MSAFAILGTNAAPAIPDLVALMKGTNLFTVGRSIAALSSLGPPAFPHMAAALTNTNQTARAYIPLYIRLMARDVGTNACLSPLNAALQDPDPGVRAAASHMLRILIPAPLTNAAAQ